MQICTMSFRSSLATTVGQSREQIACVRCNENTLAKVQKAPYETEPLTVSQNMMQVR